MARREFSRSTKVARFKHAKGHCEYCGTKLQPGRIEYDHEDADGLTGDNSFENCRAVCIPCHSIKTKQDVAKIAKAKRREARHIGAEAPKQKIQSRGFQRRPKRGRIELQNTLPPPPLMRASMETSE